LRSHRAILVDRGTVEFVGDEGKGDIVRAESLTEHFEYRSTEGRIAAGEPAWKDETMASNGAGATAGGGAIYGLGIFGAWVYFWQQADSFWEYVLVLLQGLFWPAWMVYEGFAALNA